MGIVRGGAMVRRAVAVMVAGALVAPVAVATSVGGASAQVPAIEVLGPGSGLAGVGEVTATGQAVTAVPWNADPGVMLPAGAASYYIARASNGTVLMGTMPQDNNQASVLLPNLSVGVVAADGTFSTTQVRSYRRANGNVPVEFVESSSSDAQPPVGADVSDVCVTDVDPSSAVAERFVGTTAQNYRPFLSGWNILSMGRYPVVTVFDDDGVLDATLTQTAEEIRESPFHLTGANPTFDPVATDRAGDRAFPVSTGAFPWAQSRGLNECAVFPQQKQGTELTGRQPWVATQYFGGIVVFGPSASATSGPQPPRVLGIHEPPTYTIPAGLPNAGQRVCLQPREVQTDPSSSDIADMRFAIIYDTTLPLNNSCAFDPAVPDPRPAFPHLLQLFRYDGTKQGGQAIVPLTPPLLSPDVADVNGDVRPARFGSAEFFDDGRLVVTRSPHPDSPGSLLAFTSMAGITLTKSEIGGLAASYASMPAYGSCGFGAQADCTIDRLATSAGTAIDGLGWRRSHDGSVFQNVYALDASGSGATSVLTAIDGAGTIRQIEVDGAQEVRCDAALPVPTLPPSSVEVGGVTHPVGHRARSVVPGGDGLLVMVQAFLGSTPTAGVAVPQHLLRVPSAVLSTATRTRTDVSGCEAFVVDKTFTPVTVIGDQLDLVPGDGVCDAQAGSQEVCTLRAAVMEANAWPGDDTIALTPGTTFPLSTFRAGANEDGTLTGDLDVRGVLTISGAATIQQQSTDRVLDVQPGASLTLDGVTLAGGKRPAVGPTTGFGLRVAAGASADVTGGAIQGSTMPTGTGTGGGVWNAGALTLHGVTVSSNHAGDGAGIHNDSPTGGVATATIERSTLVGNTGGGAVTNVDGEVVIRSSTIDGNTRTTGSGAAAITTGSGATTTVHRTTITDNVSVATPAVDGLALAAGSSLVVEESIVATWSGGVDGAGADCAADPAASAAFSETHVGDGSCGQLASGDPGVAPLAGTPGVRAPTLNSAVVDAGGLACATPDQLGVAAAAGWGCDLGAIESPYAIVQVDQHDGSAPGGDADEPDLDGGAGRCDVDPGPAERCTLRAAVQTTNAHAGPDVIRLTGGTISLDEASVGADTEATGDLDATDHLEVIGNGAVLDGGGTPTVGGDQLADRIINVRDGAVVAIRDVTVRGGHVVDNDGGGIAVSGGGDLTLERVRVEGNAITGAASSTRGAGIVVVGSAALHGIDLEVVANSALVSTWGGGVAVDGNGTAELLRTRIWGNTAAVGGGLLNAGGTVTFAASTISDNTARLLSGGFGTGAGLYTTNASTGNGTTHLRWATIAANGGGDAVRIKNGTMTVEGTAVSAPSTGRTCLVGSGSVVTSLGWNAWSGSTLCGMAAATGDRGNLAADALTSVGDGAHVPYAGTPASSYLVDEGSTGCTTVDPTRVVTGATCDIGAMEQP